jgi:hypothetical protein
MLDLFSFDVSGGRRPGNNLEGLFKNYEDKVEFCTTSLIAKLAARDPDIKAEIIDLFAAKFLNFIRNPFCIDKVLNTFRGLTSYEPIDPDLLAIHEKITTGHKPHKEYLSGRLGIADQTYSEWLRLLFMPLMHTADDRPNLFEGVIKGLMESRNTQAAAYIWAYDHDCCLLSDRSYCDAIPQDDHNMGMSFNLCSSAFIDYVFADPAKLVEGRASPEFTAYALAAWKQQPATIQVRMNRNNLAALARYNRRVVEQCYEHVYCSAKTGIVFA